MTERQKTQEYSKNLTFEDEDEIPTVPMKEVVGKQIDLTAPEVEEIPITDLLGEDLNLSDFLSDEKNTQEESIIKLPVKKQILVPKNNIIIHDDSFANQEEESEEEDNVFFIKKEV